MAGLGEACSHVAATLFYLETASRLDGTSSCTREQCRWVIPGYQKEIPYLPAKKIDFSSPKTKKRTIETALQSPASTSLPTNTPVTVPSMSSQPTDNELISFYDSLSQCGTRPAILSLISKHADGYVPKSDQCDLPKPLSSFWNPSFVGLPYDRLLEICSSFSIFISQSMAAEIEKATRDQSRSRTWYSFRTGRVTASRMKQVCRTKIEKPSKSLLKSICYPHLYRFSTAATRWGCDHEKSACDHYSTVMARRHEGLVVEDSGLVINPKWPHIGASPDGLVNCICCGIGTLEIKCLYCHREDNIESVVQDPKSCLKRDVDDVVSLDRSHQYYYQVLTQIFVCDVEYGDFCVCTFPNGPTSTPSIHIERVLPNGEVWEQCVEQATTFFRKCILPEMVAKHFTLQPVTVSSAQALHDHTYFAVQNDSGDL